MRDKAHILLVSFPAQGHINPTLQLAKRFVRLGAKVTFTATIFTCHHMDKSVGTLTKNLTVVAFSDGHDNGVNSKSVDDMRSHMSSLRSKGSEKMREIIATSAEGSHPITCVVYTPLLTWAGEVARSYGIPSSLLFVQPATVFDIYRYYFSGYADVIMDATNDTSACIELPGLPVLSSRDLPSFFLKKSSPLYSYFLELFKEQILALDAEKDPRVLVNTFDKLEPESLKAIEKYNLIAIGPLIPSAFLDQEDLSDRSFGVDLFQESTNHIEWLNSKPKSSVIYISFGTILELGEEQTEEIAYGLLESDRPFLWVTRQKDDYTISCINELKQKGMIVPWCSQLEILSHPSLGCFVTHCGWNSTLESIVSGVPVVAFPEWTDQTTNAKLIEDVWRVGVRVRKGTKMNDDTEIVNRKEIKRCVEMVMGDEELRRNVIKWKELAKAAVKNGGSSDINLKAFVEEVGVDN